MEIQTNIENDIKKISLLQITGLIDMLHVTTYFFGGSEREWIAWLASEITSNMKKTKQNKYYLEWRLKSRPCLPFDFPRDFLRFCHYHLLASYSSNSVILRGNVCNFSENRGVHRHCNFPLKVIKRITTTDIIIQA